MGDFDKYCIQHCFIYRPSYSTVSEDAGIDNWTSYCCDFGWQSYALTTQLNLMKNFPFF